MNVASEKVTEVYKKPKIMMVTSNIAITAMSCWNNIESFLVYWPSTNKNNNVNGHKILVKAVEVGIDKPISIIKIYFIFNVLMIHTNKYFSSGSMMSTNTHCRSFSITTILIRMNSHQWLSS